MANIIGSVGDSEETAPDRQYEDSVSGFLKEGLTEARRFVEAQKGYNKISQTIDAIDGDQLLKRSDILSNTSVNYLAKVFFDMSGALTDTKPFFDYETQNKAYERSEQIIEKLAQQWYSMRNIAPRFGDVIKWALVGGSSYAHMFWDRQTVDINVSAEDPRDVFPFRPRGLESIQTARGVFARRARPISWIREMYPRNGPKVKPEMDAQAALSLANTKAGAVMKEALSPWDAWRDSESDKLPGIPAAWVYTTYLDDKRRNKSTKDKVYIGQFHRDGTPSNNWSYVVEPGDLLYPNKRCIIYSNGVILYDGPSIYWHGLYPLPKLTLDPLPWSWLGKAPLWSLLPLQKSLDRALRVVDDHIEKVARPAIVGDSRANARSQIKQADTRKPGLKLLYNAAAGKPLEIIPEPPLDATIPEHIRFCMETMDKISGNYDMSQMMRLNQMPSDNTIETMMNSLSTSVRARSRAIEQFIGEFGQMFAYNVAQFYPLNIRATILGEQGVTPADLDFDPGTFVPDFTHGGDLGHDGLPTEAALLRGPMPRYDRAREFLRQFTFKVAPNSLLNAASTEKRLLYLQLARAGLVDHWTLLEILGIPNVGSPPNLPPDITGRLAMERDMNLGMAVSAAGRKSSGEQMPHIKVSES